MSRKKCVLSTIESDCHTWNLVYFSLLLGEFGYAVVNLGPCVPKRELLECIEDVVPDLVVISTVNGSGLTQGQELIVYLRRLLQSQPKSIVIGGRLTTVEADGPQAAETLLHAGFDRAFVGEGAAEDFRAFIRGCSPHLQGGAEVGASGMFRAQAIPAC